MAMWRSSGWTSLTPRPPIEIVPEVMFSSPAISRSNVDLPQPEGPTSTTNCPSSIGTLTPCRTSTSPNDLRTSRISTDAMALLPPSRGIRYATLGRPGRKLAGAYIRPCRCATHHFDDSVRLAPARLLPTLETIDGTSLGGDCAATGATKCVGRSGAPGGQAMKEPPADARPTRDPQRRLRSQT